MVESKDDSTSPALLRVLTLDAAAPGLLHTGGTQEKSRLWSGAHCTRNSIWFGTSTGAIIASLIALGHDVDSILQLYRKHVPTVMSQKTAPARSQALKNLAREVFGNATFNDVKDRCRDRHSQVADRAPDDLQGQRCPSAWTCRHVRPGHWRKHRTPSRHRARLTRFLSGRS